MKRNESAFTLIELLAVIAIIGVLIALLLPAVQAAREAARRSQCSHFLMQFGIAAKNFEQAHGVLPSGTVNETGPIRNVPIGNHMGWMSRLLPYMEQMPLYDEIDFSRGVYDPENRDAWFANKPNIASCPSDGNSWYYRYQDHDFSSSLQHSSFVACHGGTETPIDSDNNGVFFLNSKIRSRDIPDGAAHTIFFGETRILNEETISSRPGRWHRSSSLQIILPEEENDAETNEDTEENPFTSIYGNEYHYGSLGWMSGTPGTIRNTAYPPNTYVGPFANWPIPEDVIKKLRDERPDQEEPIIYSTEDDDDDLEPEEAFNPVLPQEIWERQVPGQFVVGGFGSNHTGVTNFLFGDGSVQSVSRQVDAKIFQTMGNRRDSKSTADP